MTAADWVETDRIQGNRPRRDQHLRIPAKSKRPADDATIAGPDSEIEEISSEEEEDLSQGSCEEILPPLPFLDVPTLLPATVDEAQFLPPTSAPAEIPRSTSEVGGPSNAPMSVETNVPLSAENPPSVSILPTTTGIDVESPHSSESPLARRSRKRKGKGVAEDTSQGPLGLRKVLISNDYSTAHVNLNKDWFPLDKHKMSDAHQLSQALASPLLDKTIHGLSTNRLKDLIARCHATSWRVSDFLIEELDSERENREKAEAQLMLEESENLALREELRNKETRIKAFQELSRMEIHLERVRELHYTEKKSLEEKLEAATRKLKEIEEEKEEVALAHMHGGVELCLQLLFDQGVIAETWNDKGRVLGLIPEDATPAPDAAETQREESGGGSTTK